MSIRYIIYILSDSSLGSWNRVSQKQALDYFFRFCPFYYCTITLYFSNDFHYDIGYFILEMGISYYGFTIIKSNSCN